MKRKTGVSHGICAIVSRNHLAHARSMVASYKEHHPHHKAFVLIYDSKRSQLSGLSEPFEIVTADELAEEYPEFYDFAVKYTPLEFACVLKPFFLLYLFKIFRLKSVFYVDSDIQFYSSTQRLQSQLSKHSIVLVPHSVKSNSLPLSPSKLYGETLLLLTGAYNAGFIGVRPTKSGLSFLHWWKEHLSRECIISPMNGLFHDQRWLDLVPSTFDDVCIDRSEEFNVAFWNLHEREITARKGRLFCGKRPLGFFHFSHVNLKRPKDVGPAWTLRQIKPSKIVLKLISDYRKSLLKHDYAKLSKLPYGFRSKASKSR